MLILGIDPGPRSSGLVLYAWDQTGPGVVVQSIKDATLDTVRKFIDDLADMEDAVVVVERTQAGPPSTQVVLTTEVVGRIMERCDAQNVRYDTYYRRDVLQALACARIGNKDSLVRMACIELHGGDKATAVGTKKNPGPLYGVSSHAWQALGVVCAHVFSWHPNHNRNPEGHNNEASDD